MDSLWAAGHCAPGPVQQEQLIGTRQSLETDRIRHDPIIVCGIFHEVHG